ncbi:hypothetical protein [Mycobacterium fragae]|uniref:hypothetical protein n=1 Tax=Mycobacterium fragae TaxID=1260918 RepID=UPI001D0A8243|nr:hypothetical protein [Mycobacterium fragae]
MDLYRITHPLRLAKGSHQPGSGKGCAMNVVSYINGDEQVTDFPTCSARPLSLLVQSCNDLLAGPDGYLSPDNSVLALDLAWQTVGTADVCETVVHAWIAELLTTPTWGLLRYAKITAHKAILDVAALHEAAASGDVPSIADWDAAARAARAVAMTLTGAGMRAVQAAYESTSFVHNDLMTLDRVIAHTQNVHALAGGGTTANRLAELTRHAIRSWRRLAGLDEAGETSPSPGSVDVGRWVGEGEVPRVLVGTHQVAAPLRH